MSFLKFFPCFLSLIHLIHFRALQRTPYRKKLKQGDLKLAQCSIWEVSSPGPQSATTSPRHPFIRRDGLWNFIAGLKLAFNLSNTQSLDGPDTMSWLTTTRPWLLLLMIELAWAFAGIDSIGKTDSMMPEEVLSVFN